MPRDKQIIPRYTYPHEETYINDNSAVDLSESNASDIVLKYLSVFACGKGPDNKLVYMDDLDKYRKMFGKSNFAKYGQPHLMPEAYLATQNTGVWCMRVMPEDATYANAILSLWYKADPDNQAFRIKFTAKSISPETLKDLGEEMAGALTDRDMITEIAMKPDGTPVDGVYVDDEGYTQVPLAVFTSAGRGKYGNNLRWRITTDLDYEREYGIKYYTFEVLDVENGVAVAQHNTATIVPNPNFSETVFINDQIDDTGDEDAVAHIQVFDMNIEALYNEYVAFCNTMLEDDPTLEFTVPDLYTFDPLFGKSPMAIKGRVQTSQPFIKVTVAKTADVDETAADYVAGDYTEMDVVTIDNVAGNILLNGSDGAFDDTDADKRANAIDEMYSKAFCGDLDKLILSCRRIPATALYDANYSLPVKYDLVRLGLHRCDCPIYLDCGFRDSIGTFDIRTMETDFSELDRMVKDFDNFSENWIVSVNAHDYYIREASTGRRIRVTISYYLALTDPEYRNAFSLTPIPRTGANATLSGHVKNSLSPAVDESDKELKQALKDARINFFEATGMDKFERATDHTFASSTSDLGVEGNVIALLDFKRILEDEFRANRNYITTPERRKDFREYIATKYAYLQGTFFDDFDIKYKANAYESKRNITHVYAAVSFYPRGEITLIEIDVNQKTYREDLEDE